MVSRQVAGSAGVVMWRLWHACACSSALGVALGLHVRFRRLPYIFKRTDCARCGLCLAAEGFIAAVFSLD